MKKLGLLAALLLVGTSAHAGVGLLGGASFHGTDGDTVRTDYSRKGGLVAGLAFSTDFMMMNVEIDALYDDRRIEYNGLTIGSRAIEVPILARLSLVPSVLDIGVGPYGAFRIGSNDLNYKGSDFGLTGSVRITVPTPGVHLVVDGRYVFGLTNVFDDTLAGNLGATAHTREVQVLVGIDVPFMNN